jgi:amidase
VFRRPTTEDVMEAAARLGLHLSAEEASIYRRHVVEELIALDQFVQNRDEDVPPPRFAGAREAGHRPSSAEDPHGAWLWKCRITGKPGGLLADRTVSFKDHIAVAGIPLTLGSFSLEGLVPDFDATVVRRVLAEGGTVIGKNSLNGLVGGFGFGGGIGDYQRPVNPHDAGHLPGGSSSGSAVAVAAEEVDVSFGGDQGGSIRIPASWCGTVGLKPTFGLVSHFGAGFGWDPSLDHIGPLTRTVEDAARALEAVAGFDDGLDPRQGRDVPARIDACSGLGAGVSGTRIGVLQEGFAGVEADVEEVVYSALEALGQQGATLSKVSIPEHLEVHGPARALVAEGSTALLATGFFGAFAKTYYPASLVEAVNRFWDEDTDLLAPLTKAGYLVGAFSRANYHGRAYAKAHNVRPLYLRAYESALNRVDVLAMPTTPMKAPPLRPAADHLEDIARHVELLHQPVIQNTLPFNYTGHPALAIPCGQSSGLPISLQLVGRFFDDPLLLRVAHAYESAVEWDRIVKRQGEYPPPGAQAGRPATPEKT